LPLGGAAPPEVVAEVAASAAPAIQFEAANQALPLPLVGEAQPVIREPLAQAAGLSSEEESDAARASGDADMPEENALVAPEIPQSPSVVPPVAEALPQVATVIKPAAPVAANVPTPAKPPAPAEIAKPAVGSDWYAAQPGARFTLQILGARSEAAAQAFVKANGADYHYFKKQHQGKPLYVVTYGSFATRDAAQSALPALPAKVQAGKPWPRNYAGIQQEISQAR
jgi:DamX protein